MSYISSSINTFSILSSGETDFKSITATMIPPLLIQIVRIVLTFELFLGGQCRITPALTPTLHRRAMAKANGTQRYLSFIPIEDPKQHTRFIGATMCLAGALLCTKSTRLAGGVLSISLTLAGVYSQYKMRVPYWLPGVNTVLAAFIILGEVGV